MFTLASVICTLIFATTSAQDTKIVNGQNAKEGEFPFVVSLRNNGHHTCGGTILNENHILTAAHCVCENNYPKYRPSSLSVQYGSVQISSDFRRSVPVARIFCHTFNSKSLVYDVAVLRLQHAIPQGQNWQKVKIAKHYNATVDRQGVIVGWGRTSTNGPISSTLQKLSVKILNSVACERNYDTNHHICLTSRHGGACSGDSGTALLFEGAQIGVASFITNERCGINSESFPNVYSNVETYQEWIRKVAGL